MLLIPITVFEIFQMNKKLNIGKLFFVNVKYSVARNIPAQFSIIAIQCPSI